MNSFREAAEKEIPVGQSVSVSDLALKYGLTRPFNLFTLIRRLNPETMIRDSGQLGPSTTTGSAQLFMNSAGNWLFRGHVHESGFIGHQYVFAWAIDFRDPAGRFVCFEKHGSVSGTDTLGFGSPDSDFEEAGQEQFIADNWDTIKDVRSGFMLKVSSDPIEVALAIGEISFIGGAIALEALCLLETKKEQWDCHTVTVSDAQGNASVKLVCTRSNL